MTQPRARVYIVRHGETAENRSAILQGQLDTDLNEQGLNQARLVGDALKDVPFTIALSSDLKRAKATANSILEHHPHVVLQEDEALRERCMGKFQGCKITKEVKIGIATDSSVETRQAFADRAMKWWTNVLLPLASSAITSPSSAANTATNILVVSHGGLISTLLHELLNEGHATSASYTVPLSKCLNTAIATLEIKDINTPALLTKYGDIQHLLRPSSKAQKVVEENVDEVEVDSTVEVKAKV